MEIREIVNSAEKAEITNQILHRLPEWFGIEEALMEYVSGVLNKIYYVVLLDGEVKGFFAGEIHYQHTGELYVLGILPELHGNGIGTALYQALEQKFLSEHCDTVLVKTLGEQHSSEAYTKTRTFYRKMGFVPLIELPEIWGEKNPCLIMEKRI